MEGQQEKREVSTEELLDRLRSLGVPAGGRYSLDSKVITLWMVLSLVQGDKDHRPLSITAAMNRAVDIWADVRPRAVAVLRMFRISRGSLEDIQDFRQCI